MWLIEDSAFNRLKNAHATQKIDSSISMATSDILSTAGGTARIDIKGVLTESPDFFASFFGGGNTVYKDIIDAISQANQDAEIKDIELFIDSPGGEFSGLIKTVDTIKSSIKPVSAIASHASSAAFAIASAASTITALDRSSMVGSIGTVQQFFIDPDVVTITNRDSPNKRPDVTTDDGKSVVQDMLDSVNDLFIDAIATGRNVSKKEVTENFGRGSVFLAGEAIKRGMIDGIVDSNVNVKNEVKQMNKDEIRAQFPGVYDAIKAEGFQEGVDQEQDRVNAHCVMAESTGASDIAMKAIKDGSGMTATLQAQYMSAGLNKQNIIQRTDDNPDVGNPPNPVDEQSEKDKADIKMFTSAAAEYGLDLKGVAQ